jgi:hypothetical protein
MHCPIVASSGRLLFFAAFLALTPSTPAAAPDAAASEPKTHTLFMGADLDVQFKKDYYRVHDVSGDSFRVMAGGKELAVPMNEGPINLKVQQSLKLTDSSATIANLKGERAYTSANDPTKKFMREQPGTSGYDSTYIEDGNALFLSTLAGPAAAATQQGAPAGAGGIGAVEAIAKRAQGTASAAGGDRYSEFNSMGAYVSKMQQELALELFDAMEVTFEVSSEKPLNDPYVLLIARFHERDAKPGSSRNWIYAKALEPIDQKPRKVRIMQGGFPQGFELEKFQVHLYDHGLELATNVAERRVPLTRDEAFQYVLIDYTSQHKGASLPATPAMGKLPADLRTRLGSGQLTQFFFVKVSKDGLPVETFIDESCSHKVEDPYLQSVIRDIRFNPALDKGQPVEGIARLRFADLRI